MCSLVQVSLDIYKGAANSLKESVWKRFLKMSRESLLSVEPPELRFRFELHRQATCTIHLSNNTRHRVAFKVMTTDPDKYYARPYIGFLLPRSVCDVEVTMRGPKEVPPTLYCEDKFSIKSVIASPSATTENIRELFRMECEVKDYNLKVVYIYPSHSQSSNSERSPASHSQLNNSQAMWQRHRNGFSFRDLFTKTITLGLLVLIIWYLMLPLIGSFVLLIVALVIKMINKLVSESVEDWVVKTLLYLCIHFISFLFRRNRNVPERERR